MGGAALIVILWKMICEMLLIGLRYFERGTGGAEDYRKRTQGKMR
ncbi:hypothetical protein [Saccharibacillus alkalitolerans]|nr:hypothetical protein [Saccharibacillus alkalitolerans]